MKREKNDDHVYVIPEDHINFDDPKVLQSYLNEDATEVLKKYRCHRHVLGNSPFGTYSTTRYIMSVIEDNFDDFPIQSMTIDNSINDNSINHQSSPIKPSSPKSSSKRYPSSILNKYVNMPFS